MTVSLTGLRITHTTTSISVGTTGDRVRGASTGSAAPAGGDWGAATLIDSLPGKAGSLALKGDWTDRFTHTLNKFGVSSFYDLGQKHNDTPDNSVHAAIGETSGQLFHNRIAASEVVRVLEIKLSEHNGIVLELQRIREEVLSQAELLANGEKTSPGSWAWTNTLGNNLFQSNFSWGVSGATAYNKRVGYSGSGESVFADSSGLVNFLTRTDFPDLRHTASGNLAPAHSQNGGLAPTNGDLSNALFSVDAFAGGKFNLAAFGIPEQATADAGKDVEYDLAPGTVEKFLAQIDTAIEKVKSVIVGHGKNLNTAYGVEEYYRDAINSFIRGQEDAYHLARIDRLSAKGKDANLLSGTGLFADDDSPSLDDKRGTVADMLYQYNRRARRAHIKGWIERITELEGKKGEYEPLGRHKNYDLVKQAVVQLLTPEQFAVVFADDLPPGETTDESAAAPAPAAGSDAAKEAGIHAAYALFVDRPENRTLSPDERVLQAIETLTPKAEAPVPA